MAIKTYHLVKKYSEDDRKTPFYVEDISGFNSTISIGKSNSNSPSIEIFYSTDKETWTSLGTTGTFGQYLTLTLPANTRIYFRSSYAYGGYMFYNSFAQTIKCDNFHKVGGNIASLIYNTQFNGTETSMPPTPNGNVFEKLFIDDFYLVSAKHLVLPFTSLSESCYNRMFENCRSLKEGPAELPATNIKRSCYYQMFNNCQCLINAPKILPATTLAQECYREMFGNCYSLRNAPALPATTLADSCYLDMFDRCAALTTAPELPATTLAASCYSNMFNRCTGLTFAPELPATTLAASCYNNMFGSCQNLKYIKVGATTWDTSATGSWVSSVFSTGYFTKPTNTTIETGNSGIPSGWTVVNV